jgi:endoglucanase
MTLGMSVKNAAKLLALFAMLMAGATVAQAGSEPLQLKRGIGIHEWLNWSPLTPSGDYAWPPYRNLSDWGSPSDLAQIKALGFDYVRLSVDPGPLLAAKEGQLPEALAPLERAVQSVLDAGLKAVLDLHPVNQVKAWSPEVIEGAPDKPQMLLYRTAVAATAAMLARLGTNRTALEVMNEPQFYPCEGSGGHEWQAVLAGLVRAAREAAPDLTLIVSGACGGGTKGLQHIDPVRFGNDDGLLYSFHVYEPHGFTHQGTSDARYVRGAPWPPEEAKAVDRALAESQSLIESDSDLSPRQRSAALASVHRYLVDYVAADWGEARLEALFGETRSWAEQHGVPTNRLIVGEFGAMAARDGTGGAFDIDRFLWLSAVRRGVEALGAGWAYWEYSNPYGMSLTSPDKQRRPDPIALDALGLNAVVIAN